MKKRILPEWNRYRRAVLHPESPPDQVNDIRNAFYGGAVVIMNLIIKLSENLSENKAARALDEITQEFAEHSKTAREDAERANKAPKRMGIGAVISHQTKPQPVTGILKIEEYGFAGWSPDLEGKLPMEHLWLKWKIDNIPEADFGIRFKSREKWEEFIAMGDDIADEIWPNKEGTNKE